MEGLICKDLSGFGTIIFWGSKLQKVRVNKMMTAPVGLSATKKKLQLSHYLQYTLPPKQAKIVLKSAFFEQNKHTSDYGHLMTPYILVIKNFMTFFFSFQNFDPSIFGTPIPIQNKTNIPLFVQTNKAVLCMLFVKEHFRCFKEKNLTLGDEAKQINISAMAQSL